MKSFYLCIVCLLLLPVGSYGQNIIVDPNELPSRYIERQREEAAPKETLFQIGGIETCEDNFANLKRNWGTKYVTNADRIEILSYRFVRTLKTKRQIERLIEERLNGLNATVRNSTTRTNDEVTSRERHINVKFLFDIPEDDEDAIKNRAWIKLFLQDIIRKGFHVYEITLTYDGNQYKHLVCCNPATMRVVGDTVFNFPVTELPEQEPEDPNKL